MGMKWPMGQSAGHSYPGTKNASQARPSRLAWSSLFVAATLLTLALGLYHYRAERTRLHKAYTDHLTVVGMLKANQIAEWRRERLADAIRYAQGPALVVPALAFLRNPSEASSRQQTLHMLALNRKGFFYRDTILATTNGVLLLQSAEAPEPFSATTLSAISKAAATRQPALSALFRSPQGTLQIDTVAPILFPDGTPAALLILRSGAQDSLYPLIRFWPTASATAETLLIEQEGDAILFLNEPKSRSDGALNMRLPLAGSQTVEAQAIRGASGLLRAPDHCGNDVLADARPVPDSDWRLVTKVDESEILADVREGTRTITFSVALGLLLCVALTAFGYRRRQVVLYRNLFRLERAQRTAQERFRTILYSIGDGVIVTNSQALVCQMNRMAETLTGWSEKESLGRPLDEIFRIVNPDTGKPVESPVRRVLREGRIVGLANHTQLIARDGTWRPIADSGAPIRDEHDSLDGVVLVFRDQTAEYAAEQALRESERRLSTLLNNLPGMAYRCENDEHWTMRIVSEGCIALCGYKPADLIDNARLRFADLIHPDDRQAVAHNILAALQERRPFTLEYRIQTASGGERWVWERGCAVLAPDGSVLALEGFITDVTERRQASERQSRLELQLNQSQRLDAIGRLAGGIAHDFNTVLSVFTEMTRSALSRKPLHPASEADLAMALDTADRAARLARQLLAFASQQPGSPRLLDLNAAVGQTFAMLERLAGDTASLCWQPGDALWDVLLDPGQLDQILVNLVSNARDALNGVGQIRIETHNATARSMRDLLPPSVAQTDFVRLSVSDTGSGMSADVQAHLFEPFFTTKPGGTGLGLSTVYGIVRQNNGFIRITSRPGQGTRVSLFFPRHLPQPSAAPAPQTAPQDPPDAPRTVLLVEDQPALLMLTATLLRSLGYFVLTAPSPGQALTLARTHEGPIDLLLTDVLMPELSGCDLAHEIVRLRPGVPCVFMSGGFPEDIRPLYDARPEELHFLQKPFSKADLAAILKGALAQAQPR